MNYNKLDKNGTAKRKDYVINIPHKFVLMTIKLEELQYPNIKRLVVNSTQHHN
jgi:hypothetical protein